MTLPPVTENAKSASGHARRRTEEGLPLDWGGVAVDTAADFRVRPAAAIWWFHKWLLGEHKNNMDQDAHSKSTKYSAALNTAVSCGEINICASKSHVCAIIRTVFFRHAAYECYVQHRPSARFS